MTTAAEVRAEIRSATVRGPTASLAAGYVQANLVVLPRAAALDFLVFVTRNPQPCPLVEVVESGVEAARSAPGSDLRVDLPGYRLFRDGQHVDSSHDATDWWSEDMVSFLLGCSFSFDAALVRSGVPVRHLEVGCNVPMFITDRRCDPGGSFDGPLVVSYRPVPAALTSKAIEVTASFPNAHGGPIHVGSPIEIGINDLDRPDFGDPVPRHDGEIPMFWACGVTPQLALTNAAPEIAITHEPGHMFITDQHETPGQYRSEPLPTRFSATDRR